jgi:hypothetical protein
MVAETVGATSTARRATNGQSERPARLLLVLVLVLVLLILFLRPPSSALILSLRRQPEQRTSFSAPVGFVLGEFGFVFDFVKSPIATLSCSNTNSLLSLRLERVFKNLGSFGGFHDSPDCQMPASRSAFSLTISPRPRPDGVGHAFIRPDANLLLDIAVAASELDRAPAPAGAPIPLTQMICKHCDPVARRKKNSFVPSAGDRVLRSDSVPPPSARRPPSCCPPLRPPSSALPNRGSRRVAWSQASFGSATPPARVRFVNLTTLLRVKALRDRPNQCRPGFRLTERGTTAASPRRQIPIASGSHFPARETTTNHPLRLATSDIPQPCARSSPGRVSAPVRWAPAVPPAHTRPWPPPSGRHRSERS